MIDWQENLWKRTALLTDWPGSSVINSESLRFLRFSPVHGRNQWNSVSAWKEKFDWFVNSSQCRELDRIDGEPMEFKWKIFPRFTTLQILAGIWNMMTETQWEPEQLPGRIIFMSMYNDIARREKGNEALCIATFQIVKENARRFAHGHWSFLGLGSEKKWYGTHTYKPNGKMGYRVAEDIDDQLQWKWSSRFPWIQCFALRSKGRGTLSIHFCGDDDTAEVVLRTIIFVNHLSIYGARTDMCDELAWRLSGCSENTGKPVAQNNSETMVMPTELSTTNKTLRTNDKVQKELAARLWTKIRKSSRSRRLWRRDSISRPSTMRNLTNWRAFVESPLYLETTHNPKWKDGSVETRRSVQPWRQQPVTIKAVPESRSWSTDDGTHDREKKKQIRYGNDGRNPKTTSTTLETVPGNRLLKQDRNKYQCRCPLLRRLRYHVTCVNGSTSNQWSTTKAVSKCQKRWSDCFAILQYFEKKTEQSNSESWHQCFIQNLRLLRIGQIRTWQNFLQKEVVLRRDFSIVCVDPYSAGTILCLRAIQCHSGGKHIDPTLQDNVLLPSDFAEHIYHVGSSHDMHSIINQDCVQVAKTSRKGDMPCSSEATKPRIAVFKHNWKIHQNTAYWWIWGLLRVRDCISIKKDQARSSSTTLYLRCAP